MYFLDFEISFSKISLQQEFVKWWFRATSHLFHGGMKTIPDLFPRWRLSPWLFLLIQFSVSVNILCNPRDTNISPYLRIYLQKHKYVWKDYCTIFVCYHETEENRVYWNDPQCGWWNKILKTYLHWVMYFQYTSIWRFYQWVSYLEVR